MLANTPSDGLNGLDVVDIKQDSSLLNNWACYRESVSSAFGIANKTLHAQVLCLRKGERGEGRIITGR